MIYVVDTNIFRHIAFNVYRSVYPEIWDSLENMLASGEVVSVKEAYKELELQFRNDGPLLTWLKQYKSCFTNATNEEAQIVSLIYSHRNFQNGVAEKNILDGRPVADAFLVAKAKIINGIVVTREEIKPNAAKIPNICQEFDVPYIGEEKFQLILRRRKNNVR